MKDQIIDLRNERERNSLLAETPRERRNRKRRTTNGVCPALGIPRSHRTRHGMSKSPEHSAWRSMLRRCYDTKRPEYKNYGGRGIFVCSEWLTSFEAFFKHVGPKPSPLHSIDRIDSDGNYEPGNVRWATRKEQQQNLRKTMHIEFNGERHCLREWARRLGMQKSVIRTRIRSGYPLEIALNPNIVLTRSGKVKPKQAKA